MCKHSLCIDNNVLLRYAVCDEQCKLSTIYLFCFLLASGISLNMDLQYSTLLIDNDVLEDLYLVII